MGILLAMAAFLLPPHQEADIRGWIEKLSDDDWSVRQEATRRLIGLGGAAMDEVKRAASSGDAETARRAKYVVDMIEKTGGVNFSAALLEERPGIYEEIAAKTNDYRSLFALFSELSRRDIAKNTPVHPVTSGDLAEMIRLLSRDDFGHIGSSNCAEILRVCAEGWPTPIAEAAPSIVLMLKRYAHYDDVGVAAIRALGLIKATSHAKDIAPMLRDGSNRNRAAAVTALAAMGAKEYLGDIILLLKDSDADVRSEAAAAVGAIIDSLPVKEGEDPAAAKTILRQIAPLLVDRREEIRKAAEEVLVKAGAGLDRSLVPLLQDNEAETRLAALYVIGRRDPKPHLKAIVSRLRDWDPRVRSKAVAILGDLKASAHAKEAAFLLADRETAVRIAAVRALGAMGSKEHAVAIAPLVNDSDRALEKAAVDVLAALKSSEAVREVLAANGARVHSSEGPPFEPVDRAVAWMADKAYLKEIAALVGDKRNGVSGWACRTLELLEAREAVKDLLPHLASDEFFVGNNVAILMTKLKMIDLLPDVIPYLKNKEYLARCRAIDILAALGDRQYAEIVAPHLKDEHSEVRYEALNAMLHWKATEHRTAIGALLRDERPLVRITAVDVVRQLGLKEYAKDLVPLLTEKEAMYRADVLRALGDLGVAELKAEIAACLKDPVGIVRAPAITALGQLDAREYAKEIAAMLIERDGSISGNAAFVLGTWKMKAYVDDIVPLLRHRDFWARAYSALVLVEMGEKGRLLPASVDDIRRLTRTVNPALIERALAALKEVGVAADEIEKLRKNAPVPLGKPDKAD